MNEAKYYIKKSLTDEWEDISEKFMGVKILTLDGFNEKGESVNVYSEQWVGSQDEDFLVTTQDWQGNDVIVRKNIDLSLTFICGSRYGASDTQNVHDDFIDFVTKHGDFYIKSNYMNKEAHVVCLKSYKPTTQKLHRGITNSYIMGTLELHSLTSPNTATPVVYEYDLFIGMDGAEIISESQIQSLTNVQHIETNDISGNYSIIIPSVSFLWICTNGIVQSVTANGFEVPIESPTLIGNYRCYRSSNGIKPHTMQFTIVTQQT